MVLVLQGTPWPRPGHGGTSGEQLDSRSGGGSPSADLQRGEHPRLDRLLADRLLLPETRAEEGSRAGAAAVMSPGRSPPRRTSSSAWRSPGTPTTASRHTAATRAPYGCAVSHPRTTLAPESGPSGWRSPSARHFRGGVETQDDLTIAPSPSRHRSLHRHLDGTGSHRPWGQAQW